MFQAAQSGEVRDDTKESNRISRIAMRSEMIPTEDVLPSWYDESIDYTAARFLEARAFGRAAAKNPTWEWEIAEPSLMEVWSLSPRDGKWTDIRGAVFYAWHEARLTLPSKQSWTNDAGATRRH